MFESKEFLYIILGVGSFLITGLFSILFWFASRLIQKFEDYQTEAKNELKEYRREQAEAQDKRDLQMREDQRMRAEAERLTSDTLNKLSGSVEKLAVAINNMERESDSTQQRISDNHEFVMADQKKIWEYTAAEFKKHWREIVKLRVPMHDMVNTVTAILMKQGSEERARALAEKVRQGAQEAEEIL